MRYLKSRGYDVTYVQNITDVEDKIINKANEEGISWEEVVRRYTDSFHERLEMLGVGLPDEEPRATEYIPEMISLIQELIEEGHAYAPSEANGDVYYDVESFGYGSFPTSVPRRCANREGPDGLQKSPLDFALWKASKPGEPSWRAPWGRGARAGTSSARRWSRSTCLRRRHARWRHRPPLPPPRERARPELRGHPDHTFVRAWVHHGMVNFVGDKMAKSIGNVVDVAEAVERHGSNAIRMWLLQSHYSQPIDYSDEILEEKRRSYERLTRLYRQIAGSTNSSELSDSSPPGFWRGSTRRCATTSTPLRPSPRSSKSPAGRGRRSPPAPRLLASSPRYPRLSWKS